MIFGFLLFPDLEELDLVGPWEMVAMWSQYADGPKKCLM
ncbi:DJ-1/PfpI family protein, partial [bacterium]|nr:DJ-1/PfpI family protein [bacterium]